MKYDSTECWKDKSIYVSHWVVLLTLRKCFSTLALGRTGMDHPSTVPLKYWVQFWFRFLLLVSPATNHYSNTIAPSPTLSFSSPLIS
eukprot:scaffold5582_cov444-Prasinococcus_capsulatus_cf.AAC.4